MMGRVKEMLPELGEYSGQDDYGYEPRELEMLSATRNATNQHWLYLMKTLPAMNCRSLEQQALIDAAMEVVLAARNAYWDAGGK